MARGQPQGEEVYRPEVQPEDLPRKITPEIHDVGQVGAAITHLGDTVQAKLQADSATWAGNQLADLRLRMTQKAQDMRQDAKPGAEGYGGDVLKQFAQEQQQLLQTAGSNSIARNALLPGLSTLRTAFGDEAIRYEAEETLKYRASSAKDNADKLATIASQHPEQFGDLMGQALSDINGRRLPSDARLTLSQYAQTTIAKAAVLTRAQSDPYGTMKALLNPEDADQAILALKPAEREILLSHADALLHQRVADAERVQSLTDKREREQASSALTSLIVRSRSPQGITTADVLKAAPLFRHEPAALESALALASGKKIDTDVNQFAPRYAAAMRGEDQTEWALAHVGRDVSMEDAEKLMRQADKGMPNAYKVGLDAIDAGLRPGPADQFNYARNLNHQDALTNYQLWALSHKDVTAPEAAAYAEQLVRTHSLSVAAMEKTTIGASPPRFLVRGQDSRPDMNATDAATAKAFQAGTLTRKEFADQALLIKQWREMVAREEAARTARAAKAAGTGK